MIRHAFSFRWFPAVHPAKSAKFLLQRRRFAHGLQKLPFLASNFLGVIDSSREYVYNKKLRQIDEQKGSFMYAEAGTAV